MQRARSVQVLGGVQTRKQPTDRDRPLHLGGQRGRREARIVSRTGHQRDAAIAQLAQRIDQLFRRLHQHAFDQLPQGAFDCIFPAALDADALAHARGRIQSARLQPRHCGALLLAKRGLLQGFQRRQPTARGLRLLAHFGQLALAGALLFLQPSERVLARLDLLGQPVQRGLLGFMAQFDLLERLGQCLEVEPSALIDQRFAAAVGFQRLAIQIIDARAFHFTGTRGLAGVAVMRFPALLPVGQPRFGFA